MLFILLAAGLVLSALLWWFASLEARDERHTIFVVLVWVVLIEALLAGRAAEVPRGILRPEIAGQDFRPPDAVIVAALAARVLNVRGNRITGTGILWASFLALYVTSAAVGILNGFAVVEVLFQAKGAFYILGGMVIASGADPRKLADGIGRIAVVAGAATVIALVFTFAGIRLSFGIPGQQFRNLGALSADSITLLTVLGVVTLVLEATRTKPRWLQIASGMMLLLSPAAGTQRASYLAMVVASILMLALFASPTWRNRSSVTLLEVALVLSGLVGLAGLNFVFNDGDEIVAPLETAFTGAAEQRSAESRFALADQAIDRIQERPILGWGTGVKVIRQAQLSNKEVAAAAHNLILDLGMRVGLVGLALFVAAVVASASTALGLWRGARSSTVAAVAIAAAIVAAAVLAKGMVEPALDKFRLSMTLGIGVGLIMAARRHNDLDLAEEFDELDAAPFPRAAGPSPDRPGTDRTRPDRTGPDLSLPTVRRLPFDPSGEAR